MKTKVVLVTGASSGLGQCIAFYLSGKGFRVYGTSRSQQPNYKGVTMLKMDVSAAEQVKSAIDTIIQKEERLDVLINNAGIGMAGPLENSGTGDFLNVLRTNVIGPFETSKAVLPIMRKQKSGHIINISSIASKFGLPYRSAYCASKSALDGLTEALRMEVKGFGVQVCSVVPGDIRTSINENRLVASNVDDVYEPSFSKCYKVINEDVETATKPLYFARAIFEIIQTKKVKRSYILGKPMQRLTVMLKAILPDYLFEKIIMKYYKVK